ncbi:protein obstructor-E isoform X1 [Aphis craccivora]|uniref:Protein obstructor-E isoform X1 n=1 Tax=Aphis craccivora TaxID=307492 RepID=A0A6G0ZRB6_APHCR|nr:protein obstructor-E isoform X1 [Aphis craccivora]
MKIYLLASVLLIAAYQVHGQREEFKCPDDYGFYPHSSSCDKYWKCDNNVAELKTCGNGLAFDDTDPKYLKENCDYLHNVDCGARSQLEPAISTPHCPRLYGIFPDDVKCDTFWNCWGGEASRYQCSPGLAYDRESRVCMWADQVPECKIEEVANGFNCPAAGEVLASIGSFSRHAHPDDCRKYYICMEGTAREYGCPIGTVFKIGDSDGSGSCENPEDVPGCEDYYGDLDLKAIRKSELLSGLDNKSKQSSSAESKPAPAAPKAQPQRQQQQSNRPQPQQQQSNRPQPQQLPVSSQSSKDYEDA